MNGEKPKKSTKIASINEDTEIDAIFSSKKSKSTTQGVPLITGRPSDKLTKLSEDHLFYDTRGTRKSSNTSYLY